jgi:integrase
MKVIRNFNGYYIVNEDDITKGAGRSKCDRFTPWDGNNRLHFKIANRKKTDVSFVSLMLPEAQRIADKYGYILPRLTIQWYNSGLKLLAKACGIDKPKTSHTGRHTYATFLLNRKVSIKTVSRAMGHTNITMTQRYAKMLPLTVIEEMTEKLGEVTIFAPK